MVKQDVRFYSLTQYNLENDASKSKRLFIMVSKMRGGKLRLTSFENSPPTCRTNIAMQLILIATLIGFAASAFAPTYESNRPQASLEKNARILAYDADVKEDSYRFSYETENGIKAEEQGQEVKDQLNHDMPADAPVQSARVTIIMWD
ncbi:Cuticle protein 3 [Papilio xuthus]|uniref:Cuticle protein 3 n=1 Tax=Papilio xuthus TaxID=66420 RepID=A0A194QEY9_PAPXU|nr:Cuticle protein 3 [Papilio xuthus]